VIDDRCILVVDDESESLALLTEILAAEGYKVRCANSGRLALASLATWLPQLILLDVRVHDIDGFQICRRIKACERTRDIPLMFISAVTDVQERVAGFSLGAVDYITKPFQREELLARVHTHLELGQLRGRLEERVEQKTIELRATIERLRESEKRFRKMADTAPVMIWVAGVDKRCTFFNKPWLDFTGRSLKQELGNGWAEGVHLDDVDRCVTTYSSAFESCQRYQIEYRLRRADGEYRSVLSNGVPNFLPSGVFAGYIGSAIDITDLKRLQEETLARQKLESLAVLTRGIAHDFNNLLGSIIAEAELAEIGLTDGFPPP
jgi:PAS domain S-box-containing protein